LHACCQGIPVSYWDKFKQRLFAFFYRPLSTEGFKTQLCKHCLFQEHLSHADQSFDLFKIPMPSPAGHAHLVDPSMLPKPANRSVRSPWPKLERTFGKQYKSYNNIIIKAVRREGVGRIIGLRLSTIKVKDRGVLPSVCSQIWPIGPTSLGWGEGDDLISLWAPYHTG
jgi:hypothetical protein